MQAVRACELGQPKREPRVRDDLGRHVVRQAGLSEPLAHRIAVAVPVARVELRPGNPLRRVLRVEVEGQPVKLGVEPAPQPLGRLLAEPAERSDVVRPDRDRVLGHCALHASGRGSQRSGDRTLAQETVLPSEVDERSHALRCREANRRQGEQYRRRPLRPRQASNCWPPCRRGVARPTEVAPGLRQVVHPPTLARSAFPRTRACHRPGSRIRLTDAPARDGWLQHRRPSCFPPWRIRRSSYTYTLTRRYGQH